MTDDIKCPICESGTTIRPVKKGPDAGKSFYVCNRYPECKGRVPASRKSKTMRYLIIGLLSISVILIATGVGIWVALLPPTGFSTYTENVGGFSISYPSSWGIYPAIGGGYFAFFESPSTCAGQKPLASVFSEDTGSTSLQTWYSEKMKPAMENWSDYNLISEENVTIDDIPAVKVICTYSEDGDTVKAMVCFLVKQQRFWSIEGDCALTCWDTYKGTFNTMISSFQFID